MADESKNKVMKQRTRVVLSEAEKFKAIQFYEDNVPIETILERFSISRSTFFNIRRDYYPVFLQTKLAAKVNGALNNKKQKIDTDAIEVGNEVTVWKKKAFNTLKKCIEVADKKLERELDKMENGQRELIDLSDISTFIKTIAPYVMATVPEEIDKEGDKTLAQKHQYIMNLIQNQQINITNNTNNNGNGNEEIADTGDQQG